MRVQRIISLVLTGLLLLGVFASISHAHDHAQSVHSVQTECELCVFAANLSVGLQVTLPAITLLFSLIFSVVFPIKYSCSMRAATPASSRAPPFSLAA